MTKRDGRRLGDLVREARARAGLSQEDVARRSGLSVRALRDIEQDRVRRPHAASLARLVAALGAEGAERDRLLATNGRRAGAPAAAPAAVAIDVLGELRLVRDGSEITVRGTVPRAVLALTALRAGRPVARDEIVEALWPDGPPASWVSQVHAGVSRVRALLDPRPDRAPRHGPLSLEPGGYVLRVAPDDVDVHRFTGQLRTARAEVAAAPRDGDRRMAALGRAVGTLDAALTTWRGPVLAGEPAALRDHAVALAAAGARLEAAALLADLALELDRPDVAIGHLRPLAAAEPYHEGLQARLVLVLAAGGEQAAALATWTAIRDRLVGELGVEPGPELRHAQTRVLRGDPPARHGEVAADDADRWTVPRQLPADLPDFTGRAEELERLVAWLTDDAGPRPVVAVAGMGGVGKSALIVRLAHRLAAAHPDGQLYVNLRGADAVPVPPADVLARFLRATGVDGPAIPQDAASREDLYRTRTAGRRLLVVLDNAASAAQVRTLLPGGRGCSVLVTARTRLPALGGARWLDLDVLPTDESVALLGRVVGEDRIAADGVAAARIATLCGNLPLAVRIAGARLAGRAAWSPDRLAGLLDHEHRRLDQLAVDDLAVRASMDLGYRELDAAGRRAFRVLGVLDAPDVPADVAAAVLGVPPAAAATSLDDVVDANLLTEIGPDETGRLRYRFHDLLRLYARERAADEDGERTVTAAVRRGLAAWLATAERLAVDVPGPFYAPIPDGAAREPGAAGDGVDATAWFDAEQIALRAGIRQACRGGLDDLAFRLAASLEKYFDVRGMYEEWRATGERVMRLCRERGNLLGEAVMLRGLIDVRTWNTPVQEGTAMDRSLADALRLADMFERLGEERGLSDAEVTCAWGYCAAGDQAAALACAERALARAEATGHVGGRARAHLALALVKSFSPTRAEVFGHLESALAAARELGNPRCEASALQFLGIAHAQAGDVAAGEDHLRRSLAISLRHGDRYTEVLSLLSLARLHLATDDPRAQAEAELSLSLGRRFTMPHHVADALLVLGRLALAAGDVPRAVELLEESVALWRTRGWPRYLAEALTACGEAHRAAGDAEAASRCEAEAAGLSRTLGGVGQAGRASLAAGVAGQDGPAA